MKEPIEKRYFRWRMRRYLTGKSRRKPDMMHVCLADERRIEREEMERLWGERHEAR